MPGAGSGTDGTDTGTSVTTTDGTGPDSVDDESTGMWKLDIPPGPDTDNPPSCLVDGTCPEVDLLLVVDNSGSMGQAQLELSRHSQVLVDELANLRGENGDLIHPDVRIMVTTSDMGHPLCTAFQKPDYTPAQGAPIYDGCNARINRFSGINPMNPMIVEEVCTENCPADVLAAEHFIQFDGNSSNAPNDDPAAVLACIGPQGIDGCGYEAPLESMLRAINPAACWNEPDQRFCDGDEEWADTTEGFLRENAMLAVAMVTDELDCSVNAPGGYSYFTDLANSMYWNINPDLGAPQSTSAVCFNVGVTCDDGDGDGIYEDCASQDFDALFPVDRYTEYFQQLLGEGKDVVMLGMLGVPSVVSHDPEPPFQPTAGGVAELVYRADWVDFPYPNGEIPPDDWDAGVRAEHKIFRFGALAPGCLQSDDFGEVFGHAMPPVRIREFCESLDGVDDDGEPITRCCIESVCDSDLSGPIRCLGGLISATVDRNSF